MQDGMCITSRCLFNRLLVQFVRGIRGCKQQAAQSGPHGLQENTSAALTLRIQYAYTRIVGGGRVVELFR